MYRQVKGEDKMTLMLLTPTQTHWQIRLTDGTKKAFEIDAIDSLVAWLESQQLAGGCLTEKITFEKEENIFLLDQYLTETLNRPFIIGTAADWEKKSQEIPWKLTYEGYLPGKDEYAIESLLTVGNGFLGVRGTTPEMEIGDDHYPGTYSASLYNTAESKISGEIVTNEDLVNLPNLQTMTLFVDGEKITMTKKQVVELTRTLDLRTGLFQSWATVQLKSGKQLALHTQRFVSMKEVNQVHLRYTITPLNFSGDIQVLSEMTSEVYNYNVARYRALTNRHLDLLMLDTKQNAFALTTRTKASKITIQQQGVLRSPTLSLDNLKINQTATAIQQRLPLTVEQNQSYSFEKVVEITQYREETTIPPFTWKTDYPSFETAYQASVKEWKKLWHQAGIRIQGDLMSQKLLNLHTYHLLVSASPNGNRGLDASVTARGLHGEAYRGHIFWDELFILPFYLAHFPETARELLLYRYRRLPQAKRNARAAGYAGAMFPWQSGLDGSEQSQKIHLNPVSGQWKADHSQLQRHVSLAIAYNVWQYWQQTQDLAFMNDYGLEMLLEIAHFWQSAATYRPADGRYSIEGVMGPDEFHENDPNQTTGGLKDNAYTNMMVVWLFEAIANLQTTFDSQSFQTILTKIKVPETFLQDIGQMKHQLYLEINDEGIIAQHAGYFSLKELDWAAYREKYGNIYRMDRILNAEGLNADDYQVAKQADTLMIFYNFAKEQVDQILYDLNYPMPENYVEKNLNYYLARTTHGSTLSRIVHAQLAAIVGKEELAWQLYQEALYSDYRDIQGGTTAEGIHAGVMAATLATTFSTFAGLDLRQEKPIFRPHLPKLWEELTFSFTWRKIDFHVHVTSTMLSITSSQDCSCRVFQQEISLQQNVTTTITYEGEAIR
ncbi:glycoside hydrolase family 65 protein [Enterococcus sp. LJL98]